MITYHQGFDIYHTIFRIIKILERKADRRIERDRLRIFDFYMLFPQDFRNVTVPMAAKSLKTLFKETKYNTLPDRLRVFFQIGKYFDLSLRCLVSYEVINPESYENGIIELGDTRRIKDILSIGLHEIDNKILTELMVHFNNMSLTELKQRTGLIEYRYDLPKA